MRQPDNTADAAARSAHFQARGHKAPQPVSALKRSLLTLFATFLIGSVFMMTADAASLTGKWLVDGVPAPSGTAAMSASIIDLSDGRCRLSLPDPLRSAVGGVDVVLDPKGDGVYSAQAPNGSEVTLTVTSPAHARLEITGKSAFFRFEVLLSQVGR